MCVNVLSTVYPGLSFYLQGSIHAKLVVLLGFFHQAKMVRRNWVDYLWQKEILFLHVFTQLTYHIRDDQSSLE